VVRPKALIAAAVLALATAATGCGEEIEVAEDDPLRRGAELFNNRCSGCHTLDAAGATQGSKPEGQISGGERTNGPNFNTRTETPEDVLFAIRNGGFSGAIMPANIVVGDDAQAVADFVAEYAGQEASAGEPSGSGGSDVGAGATGN
jgi:mono/diheme cytochrome c family protein